MHTRMMAWSRGLYLAGIVLALVLVVPTPWFPFQLLKIAACALCLLGSAGLFLAAGGARELWRAHGLFGALAVALLPAAYALSLYASRDSSVGLTGFGIEVDTLAFVSLSFLTFFFGFVHFRTLRTAKLLLTCVGGALAVAGVFQLVVVLFGSSAIPLDAFADRSSNLVGKWNDLGLLLGLLAVLVLSRLQWAQVRGPVRILLSAALGVIGILLAFINFALAWMLVLAGALAVGIIAFLSARKARGEGESAQAFSAVPAVVAAVAALLLVWGATVNTSLSSVFPVNSLEVRPSAQTTFDVINQARGSSLGRLFVGMGPNTFGTEWAAHKPLEVNQSQFWSLDFNVGYSTVLTAFGTTGILGAIAWLLPLLLVLAAALRVARAGVLGAGDRATGVSLALSAAFLGGVALFYVPSANLILLMMALSGAGFGFLYRQGQSAEDRALTPRGYYAGFMLAVLLVALSAVLATATVRRLAAEVFAGRSQYALAQGAASDALRYAAIARGIEPAGDPLRSYMAAGAGTLSQLAQDTTTPASELQRQFAQVLQDTLQAGAQAQTKHPRDYRPTLALAQIYDFLAQLKVPGAPEQARAHYDLAAEKNPTNPQIPLMRARFEGGQGAAAAVQTNLQKALTLKPNYTDAMMFVTQLAVQNNDLATALQSARAAVESAPGVPSLWFQYGLLLYAGGDTANAVPVLEQAVTLVPDYANAKYYLGLAYYAQKRGQDAVAQFESLAQSNPENAEVKTVLANMRAGKADPFQGVTRPEDRTTAPVSQ